MIETYTIKKGDTPKKIAEKFGVSVGDLLSYNAPILDDKFSAGIELRNPKKKDALVKKAIALGASINDVASILKITPKEVVSTYNVSERSQKPKAEKEKKKTIEQLKEIIPTGNAREQEIFPIRATGEYREQEIFPVRPTGEYREQGLFPISSTGQRRNQEIFPINSTGQYREQELFPVRPTGRYKEQELFPISSSGQRRMQEVFPINPTGQYREQEIFPIQPTGQYKEREIFPVQTTGEYKNQESFSPSAADLLFEAEEIAKRLRDKDVEVVDDPQDDLLTEAYAIREKLNSKPSVLKSLAIEAGEGITFGFLGELAAAAEAATSSKSYERAKAEYEIAREKFKQQNPEYAQLALPIEIVASIPTGVGLAKTLGKLGVKSLGKQAGIEGAIYGAGIGEDEDRVTSAVVGGGLGFAAGKGISALTSPRKPRATMGDDIEAPTPVDEFDPESPLVTPIERIPEDELAPYSPLYGGQYQPIGIQTDIAQGAPKPSTADVNIIVPFSTLPESVLNSARRVVTDLAPDLSNKVNIVTASGVEKLLNEGLSFAAIAERLDVPEEIVQSIMAKWDDRIIVAKENPRDALRGTSFGDGTTFVNDLNIGADELSLTLDHEIGHHAARMSMGKELQKHIGDWKNVKVPGNFKAQTELGKAIKEEFLANWKQTKAAYGDSYPNEKLFDEWLADNVALWARKTEDGIKPKSKVQQWFAEQAKKLKEIWETISKAKRQRLTAAQKAESLQKFIDDFAESNRPIESLRPTSKRVVPIGPTRSDAAPRAQRYRESTEKWSESVYGIPKGPSWRDAQTAGEFWDGIKAGFTRTYDRLTPMTDLLQRRVGREPGARAQRADEAATRINQLDFEKFVAPVTNLAKRFDEDEGFREATLLHSEGSTSRKARGQAKFDPEEARLEYIDYVRRNYGDEDASNLARYLAWSEKKNKEYNLLVSGKAKDMEANYLHRQQKFKTKEEEAAAIEQEFVEPMLPTDVGQKSRKVNIFTELKAGNRQILDQYQNPFFTNTRRIMNNEKIVQYMKKFGVKADERVKTPEEILNKIADAMVKRGISREKADYAITEIRRNLLGERKLMNQTLQALQTLGYAGSLAGPKSALLNLHDIPQTAVNQGPRAVRSWFKGIMRDRNGKMLADSFGFSQQAKFGEFANSLNQSLATRGGTAKALNETANATTDALMKVSMFQLFDKVGKGGVLRSVQQRAVDDVTEGGWQQLKRKWGDYFSDNELKIIARDLEKHGMDDTKYSKRGLQLTEELMTAGLGQQQLISSGGRPAVWADHPNARIFLALRGFAMKQQAVALRNTLQAAKEGRAEEAKEWAIRYTLYSMGAFAAINEGRQILFGDGDPSARRMVRSFFDQLVGVVSLNSASVSDYSWGKLQRGELLGYVIDNNIPIAIGVPKEAVEDALDVMTGEKEPLQLPETLPLYKQTGNLIRNVQEFTQPTGMLSSN